MAVGGYGKYCVFLPLLPLGDRGHFLFHCAVPSMLMLDKDQLSYRLLRQMLVMLPKTRLLRSLLLSSYAIEETDFVDRHMAVCLAGSQLLGLASN